MSWLVMCFNFIFFLLFSPLDLFTLNIYLTKFFVKILLFYGFPETFELCLDNFKNVSIKIVLKVKTFKPSFNVYNL